VVELGQDSLDFAGILGSLRRSLDSPPAARKMTSIRVEQISAITIAAGRTSLPMSRKATPTAPAKRAGKKPTAKKSSASKNGPADVAVRKIADKVVKHLAADYPDVTCALENETPFQLLVATILSAQCTDARVNMVTPSLFSRWPSAAEMATAPIKAIEKVVQSTGFYRNKAKNIKACSQMLMEQHDGEVPREMGSLVALAGVGRKTANVVLGTAYGLATGVVVDTHVSRISHRLGLTKHSDATKIEQDLMRLVPQKAWVDFAHRMIHHGRQICAARKPKCDACSMNKFCPKIGVK
jgi:endonuclease-3